MFVEPHGSKVNREGQLRVCGDTVRRGEAPVVAQVGLSEAGRWRGEQFPGCWEQARRKWMSRYIKQFRTTRKRQSELKYHI